MLSISASGESFTAKVEAQEGAESVVLPCQYNQVLEEVVTVKWSRRDLNPSIVHQRREGDDLQLQNQLFSGRTSMRSDALDSGNFSLTLRNFQLSDIGKYVCSMIDDEEEKTLSEVELQLKGQLPGCRLVSCMFFMCLYILRSPFLIHFIVSFKHEF